MEELISIAAFVQCIWDMKKRSVMMFQCSHMNRADCHSDFLNKCEIDELRGEFNKFE